MKKVLYLLILMILFVPTFVFAKSDVEIKSIDRIDITSGVEEISEPSFNDLDVEFKLKFLTQGDYVKYNITLVNNSNKDYQVSDDVANFKVSDYIDYSFSFDNNSSVIKANCEKVVSVTISYKKAVNESSLTDGRFIEDNSLSIKLSNGNLNNPNTGRSVLFGLIFLIVIGVLYLVLRDKKKMLLSVLILSLFIPIVSYAIDLIQININSHIEVDGSCPYRIVTDRGSFVEGGDVKEICVNAVDDFKITYETINFAESLEEKSDEYKYASIGIDFSIFTEDSYLRVYDDSSNELIREFTSDDFITFYYSLSIDRFPGYFDYVFSLRDADNYRVELSDDLIDEESESVVPYSIFYTKEKPEVVTINGPWVIDENTLEKIFGLDSRETDYDIYGYTTSDNSHVYHITWGPTLLLPFDPGLVGPPGWSNR